MLKAYRYRLYPTEAQKVLLSKHFGCTRWIYNWALAEKMARYIEAGVNVSIYELQRHLTELKERPDTEWLGEVSAQSLGNALIRLDSAYTRFFRDGSGFPQFKTKGHHDSFQNHQYNRVSFDLDRFYCLKFREGIRCRFTRCFDGNIKTCTILRTPTGKHYVSIIVETPEIEPTPPPMEESKALGLDFGLKDLVVTSDGERFKNPRTLKRYLRRLQIRQRRLSRKVKGSNRRNRARHAVARVHERISNIRNDNLHKISSHLVRENQATTLCIEDLSVSEMLASDKQSKSMKRSIQDASWGNLRRQLEYKCRWHGKNLRVIGRFEPSSKMCSNCGAINRELTLSDRSWTCVCGSKHDRDVNAAINIRTMAFRSQNTLSGSPNRIPAGSRKSTPEEQAVRPAVSRECQSSTHVEGRQCRQNHAASSNCSRV